MIMVLGWDFGAIEASGAREVRLLAFRRPGPAGRRGPRVTASPAYCLTGTAWALMAATGGQLKLLPFELTTSKSPLNA